jgi:predicted RNase H-related nuclease YkuK (DUF458 family)
MDSKFHSSLGMQLSVPQVVAAILDFMQEEPERRYKITLGTDSELLASKQADFVTAIVVHRVGNGGRYFWRRFNLGKFHTLRDRIIQEVMISLDAAKLILTEIKKEDIAAEWDFEIHVDVGENGPTKPMIQEVVGMVRAHNFEARTKPESYAASSVADRHV